MGWVADDLAGIVAAQQWPELGRFLDDRFIAALLSEPDSIAVALQAPPEEWFREHPRYSMARAVVGALQRPLLLVDDEASGRFAAWVASQKKPAMRDVVAVMQTRLHFLMAVGRLIEADALASEMLDTIDRAPEAEGFHDVLPLALVQVGTAKLLVGRTASARRAFLEAHRWVESRPEHPMAQHTHNLLALAHALEGNYARAAHYLPATQTAHRSPAGTLAHRHEMTEALAFGLVAAGRLDRDGVDGALAAIDSEQAGQHPLWWVGTHLRARRALYWGGLHREIGELEDVLSSQRLMTGPRTMAGTALHVDLADLFQADGDVGEARRLLESPGLDQAHPAVVVSRARLDLLQADPVRALARLSTLRDMAASRVGRYAALSVLRAVAEQRAGGLSRDALRTATISIAHNEAPCALVEAPVELRELLIEQLDIEVPVIPEVFPLPPQAHLTKKEHEVLLALWEHETVAAVAASLHLSSNTVKSHLRTLYRKLGVHGRDEALRVTSRLMPRTSAK